MQVRTGLGRVFRLAAVALTAATLAAQWIGCGKNEQCNCMPADHRPPAAVTDLALDGGPAFADTVFLRWTATGDDSTTGTAEAYDLRYRLTDFVAETDWTQATPLRRLPTPGPAGTTEVYAVTRLAPGTYYFALKARDDFDNWSRRSNSVSAVLLDVVRPAAVNDLRVDPAAVTHTSLQLLWTATGGDSLTGTAAAYDLRYNTSGIASPADWEAAVPVMGIPTPSAPGAAESLTVSGLEPATTYYFALQVVDDAGLRSALSLLVAETSPPPDAMRPAAVTDLRVNPAAVTRTSLRLLWTATGDDSLTGTAAAYDLRYNTGGIASEAEWDAAVRVTGIPAPNAAETAESLTVSGLEPATTYYFALQVVDDAGLRSARSLAVAWTTASRWRVDPDGSGDCKRITPAIIGAADLDTIEVAAGTYSDTLLIQGKSLVLLGAGADSCIVAHTTQPECVLTLVNAPGVFIRGFGFTQESTPCNNGLEIKGSDVAFKDCAFFHCGLTSTEGSEIELLGCTVEGQCQYVCDTVVPFVLLGAGRALFERCIISAQTLGNPVVACDTLATVTFKCCDILAEVRGSPDPVGADGNFSADPMYRNAAAFDFHLLPGSPCLPGSGACGLVGAFGSGE